MIGIVGGMGPYAGIDLLKKVYDNTIANNDQEYLDTVILSISSSIKDRTDYLMNRIKENPAYAIAQVLLKLQEIGVTVAGISCNTAHSELIFNVILNELIKKKSTLKLLNMISETISFIADYYPDFKRIGVLSTTGTYKSGVYSTKLRFKKYEVIVPTLEMQEEFIHPAIYDSTYGIKSFSNPVHPQAIENLQKGISFLKAEGVQLVILGCTEMPLAIPQKEIEGMIIVDPTNILARSLINNFCPKKLKEI
jgi:aspartate racemase